MLEALKKQLAQEEETLRLIKKKYIRHLLP
jgi:hypothetical protein